MTDNLRRGPWDIAQEESSMPVSTPMGRVWGGRIMLACGGFTISCLVMVYGAMFNHKLVAGGGAWAAIFFLIAICCFIAACRDNR